MTKTKIPNPVIETSIAILTMVVVFAIFAALASGIEPIVHMVVSSVPPEIEVYHFMLAGLLAGLVFVYLLLQEERDD